MCSTFILITNRFYEILSTFYYAIMAQTRNASQKKVSGTVSVECRTYPTKACNTWPALKPRIRYDQKQKVFHFFPVPELFLKKFPVCDLFYKLNLSSKVCKFPLFSPKKSLFPSNLGSLLAESYDRKFQCSTKMVKIYF